MIKIFERDGVEWFAAENLQDARDAATEYWGDDYGDEGEWIEVPDERLDVLTYADDLYNDGGWDRTFRAQLAKLEAEDAAFPCFFATSEG